MVSGTDLVATFPQLQDYASVTVLEFSKIGSYRITPDFWFQLFRKIEAILLEDLTLAGVVITHGTDTIDETAFFLHLTLKDSRPVVLCGAMKMVDEVSPDGPANLLNAVRVAADLEAKGRGVLLVFNETILSARDAWKSDNRRPETFRPVHGTLGVVDPEGVRFYRKVEQPHTLTTEFDLSLTNNLPRVEIITDFTGFDASILDYFLSRNLDGLVFQSMAGGRLSQGAFDGLKIASESMVVVISSKVPLGRIVGDPNPGLDVIYARDLSASRARILLMLALMNDQSLDELRGVFEKY
ncbi:MAG: asparaginase [Saprospiraceae bacterium]|nr:asparaginase [Saprospiraceae bacterium]